MVERAMILGTYFDGRSAEAHPTEIHLLENNLDVVAPSFIRRYPISAVRIGERFAATPCVLNFADGSRCEVIPCAAGFQMFRALGYRETLVQRWQKNWWAALAALVVIMVSVMFAYVYGIPYVTEVSASRIPAAWERRLGDEALVGLDKELFKPSTLADERKDEAREIFRRIIPENTRVPLHLEFRQARFLGPNAIALPNGTIVVTDAMILHIAGTGSPLIGDLADELAGVLAHEIGHVQGRHSLKKLIQGSATGALSWYLWGDFSSIAAGAPAMLLQMEYSREMENEADNYAVGLLERRGISPTHLADLFESLGKVHRQSPAANLPRWLRTATDYVSTHPNNDARIRRIRDMDGATMPR